MSLEQSSSPTGTLRAKNVGGIRETAVEFSPGVTLLVGRNTTNRTSFLQALMAALGGDDVAVKGDADVAEVELELGDEEYTRRLRRESGSVVSEGDPYLDDAVLAELFTFLLESNEARRAVATGGDLRDIIMEPVDTEAIQAEIESLVRERESLEEELEEISDLKGTLPELEEERASLEDEIEEKRAQLAETESELESMDEGVEETREAKSQLQEKLDELRAKRGELDDVRYDLETERESLDSLESERRTLESEVEDLSEPPETEIEDVESRVDQLRTQKQRIETEVDDLQSVIGFNEEMLSDADSDVFRSSAEPSTDDVTDQLLEEDEVTCWTCGTEVGRDEIESTLDQLRELSQARIGELTDLEDEIDELRAEKRELEQTRQEYDRLTDRLDELDDEIAESEAAIERLQDSREELTDEIQAIEDEVEDLEDEDRSAVLDLHREANEIEYELGRLENDLERVEGNIADVEDRIEAEAEIQSQLDAVKSEIADKRTAIERIEESAIEEFNEHMETVLEKLNYTNIERIWLERVEREVREGRQTVTRSVFELHVVRKTESDVAYEDTVDHLSESEREVTGLVFALSGYLAHELYEDVPVMLLDSLEAIDSERIATLVDYLQEYTEYLFVALLPEDAAALSDDYEYVTDI